MTPIQVVGIGLDGAPGLTESVRKIVSQATLLVGSDRHLCYFPDHPADRVVLGNLRQGVQAIRNYLSQYSAAEFPAPLVVVLASGDPLFFGLGRLLLAELPAEQLTFHPHLSALQLAFSRVKVPWQDACLISAHGRSLEELTHALRQGAAKIAVLTDLHNTPAAIARLLLSLDLPNPHQIWVCENLGDRSERVRQFSADQLAQADLDPTVDFAALNVVVLMRVENPVLPDLARVPALGIPDSYFFSFSDRPGLMTKREVRLLALGELALRPQQVIWDIGAGTGSVSIEIARLFPSAEIYAIEKTAAGMTLIQQNCERFQVQNVKSIYGAAPEALSTLPAPDRVFIGGSGGNLDEILSCCGQRLASEGVIVLAIATVEHLNLALRWREQPQSQPQWHHHLLQVQLSRSVAVGPLTRFAPLNPVTLLTLIKSPEHKPRSQQKT